MTEMISMVAAVLAAGAPLLFILSGLLVRRPASDSLRAEQAAWVAFGLAVFASGLLAVTALTGSPDPAALPLVYFDAVSAAMLILVSFLGAVIIRYSRNNLAGDPGQARFFRWLCLTIGAVLVLVVAGNLALFFLGWLGTSLSLHRLLIFYPDRPAARFAARKKFVLSRLGDLCLLGAIALIWQTYGTLDFAILFAVAGTGAAAATDGIALLLVGGALLKSAQFPFHTWLPETMETPTSVSALMHAGIINAGGFLIIRLSPLVVPSSGALNLLLAVGVITALFASFVMLTQPAIKRALAYSTVAQMGFMMFQCGLGLFPLALLHIVAHSLYKAHAFLSSGSAIENSKLFATTRKGTKPSPVVVGIVLVTATVGLLAIGATFGVALQSQPGVLLLGLILMFGVIHLLLHALAPPLSAWVIARSVALTALVAALFFGLHTAADYVLGSAVAVAPAPDLTGMILMGLTALLFAAVPVVQAGTPFQKEHPFWQALYVHASNGFYLGTITNRWARKLEPQHPAVESQI